MHTAVSSGHAHWCHLGNLIPISHLGSNAIHKRGEDMHSFTYLPCRAWSIACLEDQALLKIQEDVIMSSTPFILLTQWLEHSPRLWEMLIQFPALTDGGKGFKQRSLDISLSGILWCGVRSVCAVETLPLWRNNWRVIGAGGLTLDLPPARGCPNYQIIESVSSCSLSLS